MKIAEEDFYQHSMNKLIKGAVVPRPIAWVSSVSEEGVRNIAPFSFFTVASMNPITLCFSMGQGDRREKDTLRNIRETKQFIINVVSESLANQMHESSKSYEPGVDEFERAGIAFEEGDYVPVPRAINSPVHMECELDQVMEIGEGNLVLGRLVGYHIDDEVYEKNDKVDPLKLNPIGRMAEDYSYIREFFPLPNKNLPK